MKLEDKIIIIGSGNCKVFEGRILDVFNKDLLNTLIEDEKDLESLNMVFKTADISSESLENFSNTLVLAVESMVEMIGDFVTPVFESIIDIFNTIKEATEGVIIEEKEQHPIVNVEISTLSYLYYTRRIYKTDYG